MSRLAGKLGIPLLEDELERVLALEDDDSAAIEVDTRRENRRGYVAVHVYLKRQFESSDDFMGFLKDKRIAQPESPPFSSGGGSNGYTIFYDRMRVDFSYHIGRPFAPFIKHGTALPRIDTRKF
jgi:hypothetical protein